MLEFFAMPLLQTRERGITSNPARGWTSPIGWTLLVAIFLALLVLSTFVLPRYLVDQVVARQKLSPISDSDRLKAENDVRGTLLQGLGGLALFAGVIATWRQIRITQERNRTDFDLGREAQITERFTEAIGQLGNQESVAVRLGGIYALERIARDSARDQGPIVEVLTAFVRERAPWKQQEQVDPGTKKDPSAKRPRIPKLPTEIQAVLTVLGRRLTDRPEPPIDLSGTDLRKAYLEGAELRGANFCGANLKGANLNNAHLEGANFTHVELTAAHFQNSHLQQTTFFFANMNGTNLDGANLEGSDLMEVQSFDEMIIKSARNWKLAYHDPGYLDSLELPPDHNEQLAKVRGDHIGEDGYVVRSGPEDGARREEGRA